MLKEQIREILLASKKQGWVMEPEAKRILSLAGLSVPRFIWTTRVEEAVGFSTDTGYPVVAKIVSSEVVHKSDVGGVITGINGDEDLKSAFSRLSRLPGFSGVLVEEMLEGVELILGAKTDHQFGPVILLGIGGTGVEIYKDTALRMAPLQQGDIASMVRSLKAHGLLEGYRGSKPVDLAELTRMMLAFSDLMMGFEGEVESIDLNPVICSSDRCVVADARIMLRQEEA